VPANAAFWIYALDRTTLQVRVVATSEAQGSTIQVQSGDMLIPVVASTASSRDAATLVGVLASGELKVENPPAIDGMVDLYVEEGGQAWAAAVRAQTSPRMTWRLAVVAPAGATEVAIELPDLSRVPADKVVMLTDLDTGRRVYMRTQPRYVMAAEPGQVRHLELAIEDKGANCLVVSSARAQQQGSRAVVTFAVSSQARIQAEVMNIAGRVVRVLAKDYPAAAGANTITWDLRNSDGSAVPAGRYIIRIVAAGEDGQQVTAVTHVTVRR
jgi:hypothetical protein